MMQGMKRSALPLRVHYLWDAIDRGTTAPQGPVDYERLMAIVNTIHPMPNNEMNRELENAIKDGLIISEVIQTQKREESEIYRLPDVEEFEKGEKDWYCFQCHVGGGSAVVACEDCPRIFHLDCLPDDRKPQKDLFVCPPCHIISTKPSAERLNLKQKQLNTLIEYSCSRYKKWGALFLNCTDGAVWAKDAQRDEKDAWRFDFLVYFNTDLTMMLEKAHTGKYASLEEYQVDCETLAHSVAVYYGPDQLKGQNTTASFLRDVMHDIQEIKLCHDCFRQSNEKQSAYWFCLPCTRPHEVVWAKQTGYPYWPAKVMKHEGAKYDVRYFGGNHERGMIDEKNIQQISVPVEKLKIRKTAAWIEAYDELQKFLDIAENPDKVNSLPVTKGGKGSPAKSGGGTPRGRGGSKRAATTSPVEEVVSKKPRKSSQPAGRKSLATPNTSGRGRKASMNVTPASGAQVNGTNSSSKKKPGKNSPLKSRRESANINVSGSPSDHPRQLSKEESSEVPDNLEPDDISFLAGLEDDGIMDDSLSGTVTFSDEEIDEQQDKASDDAVSSSVNDKSSVRNVYVQTNTSGQGKKNDGMKDSVMKYIANLKERHALELSATKRKQWCYNCEREAIYHCCWNTAYCSIECQQLHWSKEHKRLCRQSTCVILLRSIPEGEVERLSDRLLDECHGVRRERGGAGSGNHGGDEY